MIDLSKTTFLNDAEIAAIAPSVFTTTPSSEVSKHYTHIPTTKVIDDMRLLGWDVVDAKEVRARKASTRGVQKHLVVFRNPEVVINGEDGDEVFPQILLTNSHDGKNAFTFTAGLYNLGIEGQITAGAIASTLLLRLIPEGFPPAIAITLAILFGIVGGGLWGLLAGVLNIYGKVSEIFAGLGMNFTAQGLALYLVFGPWKRSGVASMSGTEPFSDALSLPTVGNTDFSPIALAIAIFALIVTAIAIRATYFGLKLKAVGNNLRAAHVLGIPAIAQMLSSFVICGAFAGIAGSLQVVAVFHRLIPNVSSNLGFLALLVVMLINYNPFLVLPIAFLFSSLNVGSLELPLSLSLDSSLSGIIQGALLLFAILGEGLAKLSKET